MDRAHDPADAHGGGTCRSIVRRLTAPSETLATFGIVLVLLVACGGLPRPDQVVEPVAADLIVSVDRSEPSREIVELESGESVAIDSDDALELAGPGIDSGRVLLYGDDPRAWFVTASTAETVGPPDCFMLHADAAFDEPQSVLVVFAEWRDTAIELRKRDDFSVPPGMIRPDGRYEGGEVAAASVCIDSSGLVFGLP